MAAQTAKSGTLSPSTEAVAISLRDDSGNPVSASNKTSDIWYSYADPKLGSDAKDSKLATFLQTMDETAPNASAPGAAKLGLIRGVYLPTLQNIFGVIVFVRLAWMIGVMGIIQTFIMVFMCCMATFLTALSLSALATNGIVKAGGPYFMISRNLGPESGGAVGICFYLANAFAVDLYVLGALEILLKYITPAQAVIFGNIHTDPFNDYRLYGTILLIVVFLVVLLGVQVVQTISPVGLVCVVASVIAIIIGSLVASDKTKDVWICLIGDVLMIPPNPSAWADLANYTAESLTQKTGIAAWCNDAVNGSVWSRYCSMANDTEVCTEYYKSHRPPYFTAGLPGLPSGIFMQNLHSRYMYRGDSYPGYMGSFARGEVVQDFTTSFLLLAGIYFPSVTGVLAGSNNSGYLKDPPKVIPKGTIAAQLTTSFAYLGMVFFIGGSVNGALLRDKYGDSIGGELVASILCWPNKWLVLVGSFCSTLGAGLQSMNSAPRLLSAIARDGIIPFLSPFGSLTKGGEPLIALLFTVCLSEIGIMIARLDLVTPVMSIFFMITYAIINMTCFVLSILETPNWRPRFRYHHWTLSLAGVILNVFIAFMAGWYYALIAFGIVALIYKYIQYKGSEKEYGDGIRGLHMTAAQEALLNLEDTSPHTKNWRPQLLIFCKLYGDFKPAGPQLFTFASHLKAGKGLTIVASIIQGDLAQSSEGIRTAKIHLKTALKVLKVRGFTRVVASENIYESFNIMVQATGLGGLNPNTVVLGWPYNMAAHSEVTLPEHIKGLPENINIFLHAVRVTAANKLALLVVRGLDNYPDPKMIMSGTIDIWWIIQDGGMLLVLAFLLQQNKSWHQCRLRIFTVAQEQDNSVLIKRQLEKFVYDLRINAEVYVIEFYSEDVMAYTMEQTLIKEQREEILKKLNIPKNTTIEGVVPEVRSALKDMNEDGNYVGTESPAKEHKPEDNVADIHREEDGGVIKATSVSREFHPASYTNTFEVEESNNRMRMRAAYRINEVVVKNSSEAALVIMNFPTPPSKMADNESFMLYLIALSSNLKRVILVRGSGREVVTIYS